MPASLVSRAEEFGCAKSNEFSKFRLKNGRRRKTAVHNAKSVSFGWSGGRERTFFQNGKLLKKDMSRKR